MACIAQKIEDPEHVSKIKRIAAPHIETKKGGIS